MISPYSKTNYTDHTATEQASITKFIEDNWHTGRIGGGSFDQRAGSLTNLFDFRRPNDKQVLLKAERVGGLGQAELRTGRLVGGAGSRPA